MAQAKTVTRKSPYETEYRKDYESDWDVHSDYIKTFDAYEAMLIGQVYDSVSKTIDSSKITDSYVTTLAKERADRVMAKMPDGQTQSAGKADVGKAAFMDILRQKWYYPNANAQHSFQEKLNMWQLYSSVYGYMPMFYDWNESPSGYMGPDCWLWNPRNLIPQQGRVSINDMDYVTALTWVGKKFLQDIVDKYSQDPDQDPENDSYIGDGWDVDAVRDLLEAATEVRDADTEKDTKIARDRTPQATHKGILLATRYEAGDGGQWCVFAPDHGYQEIRRIDNPHKNGRIPFVIKYSQPLFDSFYGLGDFQRAKPLQFARDGLTNFYFKGIKMNLIPPLVANANGVLKQTLDYREGAVMMETIPNSIRRLETSNAGLATYQGAQSNLTGSLLSLFGSQNASIPGSEALNPSQGRTPQAINMYSDKEATRDGAERRHLEAAIEQLIDGFNTLTVNIGTEDIPVALFADDIEDIIKSGLGDVTDIFENFKMDKTGIVGTLKINPAKLKGIEYRFNIEPDSTAQTNQQAVLQSLQDLMDRLGKYQNILQEDPTINIHWDEIMQAYEQVSGIPNASRFVTFDQNAQAQAQQPQSSPVTMPGGQVHETADMVKMYVAVEDLEGKNAIREAMGLPPLPAQPAQQPSVTSSGHQFQDPAIAQSAEAINQAVNQQPPQGAQPPQDQQQPPEPTVTSSGHVFNDATIGKAAEAITKATG